MFWDKIHSIWWEGELNSDAEICINSVKAANPGKEHMLWNKKSIINFLYDAYPDLVDYFLRIPPSKNRNVFRWCKHTDFARHLILEKFGGVYLDADIKMHCPIDSIFESNVMRWVDINDIHEHYVETIVAPNYCSRDFIGFYDTMRHDGVQEKAVMTAFFIHKKNAGVCESFVRSRIGHENNITLEFLTPSPLSDFLKGLHRSRYLILPRSYVDWNPVKEFMKRPSWNISDHIQMGSWTDKTLEKPWLA